MSASSHAMSESESRLLACQIRHVSLSAFGSSPNRKPSTDSRSAVASQTRPM
jgi:hypothetical protein